MGQIMKEVRIGVTGGRDYNNETHVYSILDLHKRAIECLGLSMTLVVGDALGADYIASQWAIERGVTFDKHVADWNEHGKAAGPLRNLKMINSGIDKLLAFPGGRGTLHMTTNAERNGIFVVKYKI
jgi:hypothetical protein